MEDPLPLRGLYSFILDVNSSSPDCHIIHFVPTEGLICYPSSRRHKINSSLAGSYSTREHILSALKSLQGQAVVEIHAGKEEDDELFYDEYEDSGFEQGNYDPFGYVADYYEVWGKSFRLHRVREDEETYDNEKDQLKRFIEILLLSLQYLAFLLQKILQYLLILCKFSEFPNRRRPKCTTMPWNIWPSLVVLWGVCWMFYPAPSHQHERPDRNSLNDEYLILFEPNLSSDFVPTAFPESVDQIQDSEWLKDVDFANLGDIMGYEEFEDLNLGPLGQLIFQGQSLQEPATNLPNTNILVDAASQLTTSQHDDMASSMPCGPLLLAEGTLRSQLNQSLLGNVSESNPVNGSEGPMQPTMMPFGILSQQMPIPLQAPLSLAQTQNSSLNADEKLICNHLGCENTHFERKCDWQTHINKHTRPFLCEVEEDCPRKTSGFATRDELKRHNEAHRRRSGNETSVLFYCSETGCSRTAALRNSGFSRKYQLREHMKRAHPGTPLPPNLIPRTARVLKTSNLAESPELMNQSLAAPDVRKRKRTPANDLATQETAEDGGEEVMPPEQELVKENERLKKQVKRLLGVIGSLTQQEM